MTPESLVGVDFSAASKAGRELWITSCRAEEDGGPLSVELCESAERKWGVQDRETVLRNLAEFISELDSATVALDFPFAPPLGVFDAASWEERVRIITNKCTNVDEFVAVCRSEFEGNTLRETEQERGGLCSYSPHIKYQTFHGISEVIAPLLKSDVSFEPMGADESPTSVIETYPAAVLDELPGGNRKGYKQKRFMAYENRKQIIESLESAGVDFNSHCWLALCDDNALDSVLAAFAAWKAAKDGFSCLDHDYLQDEGYIYA